MRLVLSTLANAAIFLAVLTFGGAANAVDVTLVGPSAVTVQPGEQVAFGLNIRNPSGQAVHGLGFSVHGYDESVADFNSGQAVQDYLNNVCFAPDLCFGGLENFAGGTLEEGGFGSNGPRVQFALSASLEPTTGTGAFDQGLDGFEGTPQFSLLFDAIAPGVTTLFIDTGYQGDAVILPGGIPLESFGTTLTINVVPEPGTALLMGLGLIGLASSRKFNRTD